jgi:hypothetical protein
MVIKSIYYINYEEDMTQIEHSIIDIFVELDTGSRYIVTLVTPKFIDFYMDQENKNYFGPGEPYIIVRKLTHEIIAETIKAYWEEEQGYYLKLHHFAQRIPETVFKKLQAEDEATKESDKAFEELYGDNDYPLYGGYESYGYESDKDEELFTYIDMTVFDNLQTKAKGILNIKTLKF